MRESTNENDIYELASTLVYANWDMSGELPNRSKSFPKATLCSRNTGRGILYITAHRKTRQMRMVSA
jgi:hypothetical protein